MNLKGLGGIIKTRKEDGTPLRRNEGREVVKMGPTQTLAQRGRTFSIGIARHKKADVPAQPDKLLHDKLSEFERQVILECRESGMTDDEIQKWLREL